MVSVRLLAINRHYTSHASKHELPAAVPAGGQRGQNPVSIEVAVERWVRLEASSVRTWQRTYMW